MGQTVGSSLKVVRTAEARKLSIALSGFIRKMQSLNRDDSKTPPTGYAVKDDARVFMQAGVPTSSESTESPGADMCFIIDTTNNDLYLVHGWSAAGTFTATLVLENTGS